jgi:nucleotide-binding universal stress UspA family protein
VFAKILAGIDGSDVADAAIDHAIELARGLQARLLIVSAYEPVSDLRSRERLLEVPADQQWTINPRDKALALLNRAAERARGAGVVEIEAHPREGDAADAILDVAEEHGCDLIVVGHRGMTGAKRFLLGSVPNKISHHAPCSVLIIRTG